MSTVKSDFNFVVVAQGDNVFLQLRSTWPLKQYVAAGTGAVSPSFATMMPCIYPVIRSALQAERVQPLQTGVVWTFEGQELAFDGSGLSRPVGGLAAGTFKSEWKSTDGDFAVPTLTVLKDIASSTVFTNKTVELRCLTNTGFDGAVKNYIEIEIEKTDGDAYLGFIAVNDGGVIDENTSLLTLVASLIVAGTQKTTGLTYQWYKMVVDDGEDSWQILAGSTTDRIEVREADIDGQELYKCAITCNGRTVEAVMPVYDETDPDICVPNPTDGSGNAVTGVLNTAHPQIVLSPYMVKRGTDTHVSGYRFYYAVTDNNGTVVASADNQATFTLLHSFYKTLTARNFKLLITARND